MKKVLIITYYWPPAGGPGVQRVLKFAKYLPQFGWEPVILTVKDGDYPAIDESLLQEIPTNIKVYKTKTLEPFTLFKFITGKKKEEKIPTFILNKNKKEGLITKTAKWIRANFFIPDARIGWKNYAVKKGLEIIQNEKIDLIFTSSPPQTVQLIGLELKHKTKLPWVADFRDPWTDAFWIKDLNRSESSWIKDRKMEQDVLKGANTIITVSQSLVELFNRKQKNKYNIIPNGFDESDFGKSNIQQREKLHILYAGSADTTQNPKQLLKAISLLSTNELKNLKIDFYGKIHSDILTEINKLNIGSSINIHQYVSHQEVISLLKNADVLLLFIPEIEHNEGVLTGKLFEYLATQNFILGVGPINGDASKIIEECSSGKMLDYQEDFSFLLKELIEKKSRNERLIEPNEAAIAKYSRRLLTEQLSVVFNQEFNG